MTPTELVERVIELGVARLDEALQLMHPDAEWVIETGSPPLRGHEEIAAFIAAELERLGPEVPEPLTTSLTAKGDTVLVYGQLRIPHNTGRRFVEMQQVAWVYEVSGDRVAKVTMFKTWDAARAAAGIAPGTPPTRRFRNWQLAVGLGLGRPAAGFA
jgi:ketosteroid isomerase-like protein